MRPALRPFHTWQRQQGMATILLVLLVGMAMTATAMTIFFRVRGAQDMQMSVHASTQAEIKAWEGVQALTQVLNNASVAPSIYAQVSNGSCPSFSIGLSGVSIATISCSISNMQLTATVTGTSGPATSTVQLVYQLSQSGSPGGSSQAGAAVTINGDLNYSGGSLSLVNGSSLANVIVNGNITIGNGATAYISGCATGDISLSGGGIANGASLNALGDITISNMSSPTNTSLAARNITITQDDGTYTAIKAGAYLVNVYSDGSLVGTAYVGGTLSGSSVIPNSNSINVTLVSGASATYSYPTYNGHTITLGYNSVYGGVVKFSKATVGTMWGNQITLTGWYGNYTKLYSNSDISMVQNAISTFIGGGNLTVSSYNLPTMTSGKLVGKYTNTGGNSSAIANLTTGVAASNAPGLPGLPSCAVTTTSYNVSDYKNKANYTFYINSNNSHPMVTILNVKTSTGIDVSGTYDLTTDPLQTLKGFDLFQCQWYNASCFSTANANASGWVLSGIYKWPPGIVYFDGNLKIDGLSGSLNGLINSLVVNGALTLTNSGSNLILHAPNYSTAALVCGGNFWPTNVCSSTTALGTTALANDAIISQAALSANGWTIYGNVISGTTVSTAGGTDTIYGGLYEGQNAKSTMTVSQGGLVVDTSNVSSSQASTGLGSTTTNGNSTLTYSAAVLWAKYI
ncbi:DUF342 domain-containing protein [Aquitalea magnusonii]|uniref:Uncharacterized protein n=1 Tax=Aquitalea magnusonii TaxID=332411 RepID=A0A318J863_9NEIS|nr:DUF342 domain-containing protein [Aquitalea magnusonii]PXX42745.1 hypothetical protein DFR38_11825 [Aquitalea magnusonii]